MVEVVDGGRINTVRARRLLRFLHASHRIFPLSHGRFVGHFREWMRVVHLRWRFGPHVAEDASVRLDLGSLRLASSLIWTTLLVLVHDSRVQGLVREVLGHTVVRVQLGTLHLGRVGVHEVVPSVALLLLVWGLALGR